MNTFSGNGLTITNIRNVAILDKKLMLEIFQNQMDKEIIIYQYFYARNDHIYPLNVSVVNSLPDGEATAGLANTYARSDQIHTINDSSDVMIKDTINGVIGINATFACSNHAHQLNVLTSLPVKITTAAGSAGTQNIYARIDHQHPLKYATTEIPPVDSGTCGVGNSINYARANHYHAFNVSTPAPLQDVEGNGIAGNSTFYAGSNHAHSINVYCNNGSFPKPNLNPSNGTSLYYSRYDHIHLLTVTFLANLTALGYVKSGVSVLSKQLSDGP
ncbi:MAG: hypothetical protein EZS28_000069 [Streblomastix strix]|uniref:Uncharacterized protein n=1 Tax=Streblomastix strix TaxID=222440 RepID=A0A5J4XBA6_9EUKA|nr:MAG: hypothetical protein EZS28_000069 [Streblomastix strix]